MEYTIDEVRNKLFENVFKVYDVFMNHFGEQFTDLQGVPDNEDIKETLNCQPGISKHNGKYELSYANFETLAVSYDAYYDILVWWPSVTVTNEHDKSINIQDLYAKVKVNLEGKIPYESYGFWLNRSTYSVVQFASDYMHSHCQGIPKSDFTLFKEPCLGTGPIRNTIGTLKNSNSVAMWMLFCEELSRYVTVESLKGIPYRHLETVGATDELYCYKCFREAERDFYNIISDYRNEMDSPYFLEEENLEDMVMDFTKYYLENGHLSLSFVSGRFECGMTYYEYMIDVSNSFIDFYNTKLKEDKKKINFLYKHNFLIQVIAANGKFMQAKNPRSAAIDDYQNQLVCTFKGKEIRTKIERETSSEATLTTLLNWRVAMRVISDILKIINFRFKNEYPDNRTASNMATTEGSGKTTAKTHKTVYYI